MYGGSCKNYKVGNLTLTKRESIFSEMPRVHVEWVSLTCQMYRLINLIGHTWHPYFSEHTGWPNAYVFSKNSNQNSQSKNSSNQNYSEERDKWNKNSHSKTLKLLDTKAEGYQARPWHIIEVKPPILVRIPPFSLVSPGGCTYVCACGVYKTEGPP